MFFQKFPPNIENVILNPYSPICIVYTYHTSYIYQWLVGGPSCPRYIEHTDCRADKLTSSPLSLDIQLRVAKFLDIWHQF